MEVIILEGDPIENAATQLEKVHSKIIEIKADFDSNEAESNTSEKTKEVIVLECDPTEDAPTKLDSSSSKIKFSDGDPSLAPEGLVHEE